MTIHLLVEPRKGFRMVSLACFDDGWLLCGFTRLLGPSCCVFVAVALSLSLSLIASFHFCWRILLFSHAIMKIDGRGWRCMKKKVDVGIFNVWVGASGGQWGPVGASWGQWGLRLDWLNFAISWSKSAVSWITKNRAIYRAHSFAGWAWYFARRILRNCFSLR